MSDVFFHLTLEIKDCEMKLEGIGYSLWEIYYWPCDCLPGQGLNFALGIEEGYLICKLEILTVSVLGRKWGGPQVGGKEDLIVFQGPALHGDGPGQRSLPSVDVRWPSNMTVWEATWEARDGQGWPQWRAQLMDPKNMYIWCPVLFLPFFC